MQLPNNIAIFLNNIYDNGFIIFVSAFLLTLFVYHFLLFFQHKDKAYLYYSLYTFLIFIYTFHRADNFFLANQVREHQSFIDFIRYPSQWLFHTIYLLFVKTFLDFKKHIPKWNRFLNVLIAIIFTILFGLFIEFIFSNDTSLFRKSYLFFFLPIISIVGIIVLFVASKLNSYLKYYLIVGSGSYIILSLSAFYFSMSTQSCDFPPLILFYFGVIIENIFFALGLGAKQKKIMKDRNLAQEAVIKEHQINLQLQKEIKEKLDHEVASKTKEILALTRKNEIEQRKILAAEYSKRTLDLKMRALQTQMNPHFLFNSLNSIKHFIIKEERKDALFFLLKLSKLLRQILEKSQLNEITLEEELKIIQLYLDVENIRLEDNIELEIIIAKNVFTSEIKLPPLILQPFIENAIWHGLLLKKGLKRIVINVSKNKNSLLICIEDNGIGREKAAIIKAAKTVEKQSLGIDLTKQRIQAFTEYIEGDVSITFKDLYEHEVPSGTRVYIRIPMLH